MLCGLCSVTSSWEPGIDSLVAASVPLLQQLGNETMLSRRVDRCLCLLFCACLSSVLCNGQDSVLFYPKRKGPDICCRGCSCQQCRIESETEAILKRGDDALPARVPLLPGDLLRYRSDLPAPNLGLLARSLSAPERLMPEAAVFEAARRASLSDAVLVVAVAFALALSEVCLEDGACALSLWVKNELLHEAVNECLQFLNKEGFIQQIPPRRRDASVMSGVECYSLAEASSLWAVTLQSLESSTPFLVFPGK